MFKLTELLPLLAAVLAILLLISYFYVKRTFSYWTNKNVPQVTPTFPFGNFASAFFHQKSLGCVCADLYANNKDKRVIGIYISLRPALLINDPELVKEILVRDCNHFQNRGFYMNQKIDPLCGHLFALTGERCKNLRDSLMPSFTAVKLKGMFSTLLDTGKFLQSQFDKVADSQQTVEIRDVLASFSTDIMLLAAFGFECDSLNDLDTKYREIGRKFFKFNIRNNVRLMMSFLLPQLNLILGLKSVNRDVEKFMLSMVRETIDLHGKSKVSKHDFIQQLQQLKNMGRVSSDDEWNLDKNYQIKPLTLEEMTAQVFVFLLAGLETSSTFISFCVFELAKNLRLQEKLQREIDEFLKTSNNQLTYDGIMKLKFLNQCIDETLRKYPSLPLLIRECTSQYQIPGTNFELETGTTIIVPLLGLQNDPQYYPEPEKFKPERFSAESKQIREDLLTYAPFGDSARICICSKMGKMMTQFGLALMFSKFNFQLADTMKQDLEIASGYFLRSVSGINVKVTKRQSSSLV